MKPTITIYDASTGETSVREMTGEEYDELIAYGMTLELEEETIEE